MASIFNDSTATLYVLLSDATVSSTNYTVALGQNVLYELPLHQNNTVYAGRIVGIWTAAGSGAARITEET
jgi:hypothetical protein